MPTDPFRLAQLGAKAYLSAMGFFATDILESATPSRTDPERARQHSLCGQKPLRGPIHNAISGYRYYNTELGRWINRDQIEEEGGLNVYRFVGNGGVNLIDPIGWASFPDDQWPSLINVSSEWNKWDVTMRFSDGNPLRTYIKKLEGSDHEIKYDFSCCTILGVWITVEPSELYPEKDWTYSRIEGWDKENNKYIYGVGYNPRYVLIVNSSETRRSLANYNSLPVSSGHGGSLLWQMTSKKYSA